MRGVQVRGGMTLRLASTLRNRLRGLIGADDREDVLLIAPCRDIHTFWMRRPIDVAFVAYDGTVISAHRGVGPGRRLRCRGAMATLERFACDGPWFEAGDRLALAPPPTRSAGDARGASAGVPGAARARSAPDGGFDARFEGREVGGAYEDMSDLRVEGVR